MNKKNHKYKVGRRIRLAGLILTWALLPSIAPAKTLASKALAEAIDDGRLDEVKQEMMMDAYQKQKFEFDEMGIDRLGRDLLAEGDEDLGFEILQLNQAVHNQSPRAANALGDAYREQGNVMSARVYYDMALKLDPENDHATRAMAEISDPRDPTMSATGGMELDAEAMQAAMAQAGVEMTSEQKAEMQQAMAEMKAAQRDPEAFEAAQKQQAEARQKERSSQSSSAAARPAREYDSDHEAMFCEGFDRGGNEDKRIPDDAERARYEGLYAASAETSRKWNIETMCHDALFAVALFGDVSPPVLEPVGDHRFVDYNGWTWQFEMGANGKAAGLTYTDSQGRSTTLKRLGDPKTWN